MAVIQQACNEGVSTRKIDDLLPSLGLTGSTSLPWRQSGEPGLKGV